MKLSVCLTALPLVLSALSGCLPEPAPQPEETEPGIALTDIRGQWRRILIDPDLGDNAVYIAAADIDAMDGTDIIAGRYWYVGGNNARL